MTLINTLENLFSLIEFTLLASLTGRIINAMFRAFYYEEVGGEVNEASKMVLWRVRYWFSKRISRFYMKPLFTCVWCMASVYSVGIFFPYYLFCYGFDALLLVKFIAFIPTASFFAGYFNAKINEI